MQTGCSVCFLFLFSVDKFSSLIIKIPTYIYIGSSFQSFVNEVMKIYIPIRRQIHQMRLRLEDKIQKAVTQGNLTFSESLQFSATRAFS